MQKKKFLTSNKEFFFFTRSLKNVIPTRISSGFQNNVQKVLTTMILGGKRNEHTDLVKQDWKKDLNPSPFFTTSFTTHNQTGISGSTERIILWPISSSLLAQHFSLYSLHQEGPVKSLTPCWNMAFLVNTCKKKGLVSSSQVPQKMQSIPITRN